MNSLSAVPETEGKGQAIIGERITLEAFSQLAGNLAGYPFVKLVVDKSTGTIHFINDAQHRFHSDYIAENILGIPPAQVDREIDAFNKSVYFDPDRRFYLGILAQVLMKSTITVIMIIETNGCIS